MGELNVFKVYTEICNVFYVLFRCVLKRSFYCTFCLSTTFCEIVFRTKNIINFSYEQFSVVLKRDFEI